MVQVMELLQKAGVIIAQVKNAYLRIRVHREMFTSLAELESAAANNSNAACTYR